MIQVDSVLPNNNNYYYDAPYNAVVVPGMLIGYNDLFALSLGLLLLHILLQLLLQRTV